MRKRSGLLEREKPRLEIVPMIDIMMFLLVFFVMIVLRMIPDSGVTLSLPGASTAQHLPHTDVVIIIDQQGEMHVKDQVMSADTLETYLQGVKARNDTDVIVAGDKGTKLQQLMNVMDLVRKAGITNIGIATNSEGT
ncbi:MAG TPA: biopolymer transporter ExbD [Acidocella sp.]|uniref:ExbD/TolR family protein n=1 Tax=Acidocella sp. TaxID=50710 RepID=UPI002C04E6B9|nr:biopolymer transporter ExbD [Acidocella sp.]HVE20863.1 biopolymer transporter ExbD [Acidocella sp.]